MSAEPDPAVLAPLAAFLRAGKTGSVTLHVKDGSVRSVELRELVQVLQGITVQA